MGTHIFKLHEINVLGDIAIAHIVMAKGSINYLPQHGLNSVNLVMRSIGRVQQKSNPIAMRDFTASPFTASLARALCFWIFFRFKVDGLSGLPKHEAA